MELSLIILFLAISLLVVEKQLLSKSVERLNLRIHVNGTRGKSSVSRYIAAGLSGAERKVLGKITGIKPTMIYLGIDKQLNRNGIARVNEQFRVIRRAEREAFSDLVLECMSLSPELQQLESKVFRPHIYIITNIKDDHREVMGQSLNEQANAICSAIPYGSTIITLEDRFLNMIREKASERNSTVVVPGQLEPEFEKMLPQGVFAENISLAISACELAGISRNRSAKAIIDTVRNDPPACSKVSAHNIELNFLNAFSVNDVDSTELFISGWKKYLNYNANFSVLFNTRADRPLRTEQLSKWISGRSDEIDRVLISGSHRKRAASCLRRYGYRKEDIYELGRRDLARLRQIISRLLPDKSLLVGIGNINEQGHKIINELS